MLGPSAPLQAIRSGALATRSCLRGVWSLSAGQVPKSRPMIASPWVLAAAIFPIVGVAACRSSKAPEITEWRGMPCVPTAGVGGDGLANPLDRQADYLDLIKASVREYANQSLKDSVHQGAASTEEVLEDRIARKRMMMLCAPCFRDAISWYDYHEIYPVFEPDTVREAECLSFIRKDGVRVDAPLLRRLQTGDLPHRKAGCSWGLGCERSPAAPSPLDARPE